MIEQRADLWSFVGDVTAICITTNGVKRRDGRAVMGRGCALEAKQRFPGVDLVLGQHLTEHGNVPGMVGLLRITSCAGRETQLFSFPVKHEWHERADPRLIAESARLLAMIYNFERDWLGRATRVVLPRPGCGSGGLLWEDVSRVVAPVLDDRFTVVWK